MIASYPFIFLPFCEDTMAARWWRKSPYTAQPANIASLHAHPKQSSSIQPSMFSFPNSAESILVGHDGCVNALAWSADGTMLFSGSDDRHIGVWALNEVAFPSKSHRLSSSQRHSDARHGPVKMTGTIHRSNILDVAVPQSNTGKCLSIAIGGTLGVTYVERGTSILVYDCDEDFRHNGASMEEKFGRRCEFVEGSEVLCLAAVGGEVKVFDLRMECIPVAAWKGSTFALGPRNCVYYAGSAGLSVADLRKCEPHQQHLDERVLWRPSVPNTRISGIDVSADGGLIAVSCMDSPLYLLSSVTSEPIHQAISDVVCVATLGKHKNSQTFLKRPALMNVHQQVWVGHGCDSGHAVLYEGGVDTQLAPAFQVDDATISAAINDLHDVSNHDALTVLPPKSDTHRVCRTDDENGFDCNVNLRSRCTRRQCDTRICNVVAPHPSLQRSRHFTTPSHVHPGASIIATSGLESNIHLFHIMDDNMPRMGSDFVKDFAAMTTPGATDKRNDPHSCVHQHVLQHAAVLKDKASLVFGQKRYALALEWYSQLGVATRLEAPWNPSDMQPSTRILICALWGNAALSASRLGLHSLVLAHCDAMVKVDANQPKAFYRRACALKALGDIDSALESAKKASDLTQHQDQAIELLRTALSRDCMAAADKRKKQYAKMFS
ncbi:Hypothetical protein, putative [Bodo saltans]|uniref:Uncharacterized protein n=1 Tax=Bodo saltans TaxID=75058 RepID=A0A0S4JTB8_BODSA|nr:Hypothetical protein, putative [Bodo saltans]|eukprot:CUG92646.1 Hypothetical protein, putative [Bodo saltans]